MAGLNRQATAFGDGLGMEVAYSNAMAVDLGSSVRIVYVSGQIALDDKGQLVGKGNMAAQTEQCIQNIVNLLQPYGGTLADVVQVVVYVKEMDTLADIHKIRLQHFKPPYPTSTLVQITDFVNPEALIEIEAKALVHIA